MGVWCSILNSTPNYLVGEKGSSQRNSLMFSCLVKLLKLKVFSKILQEDGDDCALVLRDEEDEEEMEGTGIPWSVIGEAPGAEEQLEWRRRAKVRELYKGEEFESEEEVFEEDEDDYAEPY